MAGEDIQFTTFDGDVITKNDYREEIIEDYVEANYAGLSKVTDFSVGSEALHHADVLATFFLEFRELIDSNYRMSMIHTMEGEFLDNHGDMVGVHREPAAPSTGKVTFYRREGHTGDIFINDNTRVYTDDAIGFLCDIQTETGYLVLESAQDSVEVNVICEQDGAYTNVTPGTIIHIEGDLAYDCTVTNLAGDEQFIDGSDIESDDDYRNRILLAPFEVPTASLAWYNNVCLTQDSIHDVYVQKNSTGNYDISIYYNPVDRSKTITIDGTTMLQATYDIESLFALPAK